MTSLHVSPRPDALSPVTAFYPVGQVNSLHLTLNPQQHLDLGSTHPSKLKTFLWPVCVVTQARGLKHSPSPRCGSWALLVPGCSLLPLSSNWVTFNGSRQFAAHNSVKGKFSSWDPFYVFTVTILWLVPNQRWIRIGRKEKEQNIV